MYFFIVSSMLHSYYELGFAVNKKNVPRTCVSADSSFAMTKKTCYVFVFNCLYVPIVSHFVFSLLTICDDAQ